MPKYNVNLVLVFHCERGQVNPQPLRCNGYFRTITPSLHLVQAVIDTGQSIVDALQCLGNPGQDTHKSVYLFIVHAKLLSK